MSITKPANLTGCNPEIKKAIESNLMITCYVNDYNENRRTKQVDVLAFIRDDEGGEHQYLDSNGVIWNYATPVKPPERWIMPPEKAIPILIREGWKFDIGGNLTKEGGVVHCHVLAHDNFNYFGRELSKLNTEARRSFNSPELRCIIEEK